MELTLGRIGCGYGLNSIRAWIAHEEFQRAEAHVVRRVILDVRLHGRTIRLEDVTFDGFDGSLHFGPQTQIVNELLPFIPTIATTLAYEYRTEFRALLERLATRGSTSECPTQVRPAPAVPSRGDGLALSALSGCRVRRTFHRRADINQFPQLREHPESAGREEICEGILGGLYIYSPETGEPTTIVSAYDVRLEVTRTENGVVREVYYNGGTTYHYETHDGLPHGSWHMEVLG